MCVCPYLPHEQRFKSNSQWFKGNTIAFNRIPRRQNTAYLWWRRPAHAFDQRKVQLVNLVLEISTSTATAVIVFFYAKWVH
jgi:hypothetical protein